MSLLDYQIEHFENLKKILLKEDIALDSSDTGTGKTYVTIAIAKELKLKPLIICPKSVINVWFNVMKIFKLDDYVGVSNYESFKGAKYYTSIDQKEDFPYVKISKEYEKVDDKQIQNHKKYLLRTLIKKYNTELGGNFKESFIYVDGKDKLSVSFNNELKIIKTMSKEELIESINKSKIQKKTYSFSTLPKDTLIIFDEAHKCKNFETINFRLLKGMYNNCVQKMKIKMILLSATICDKIECFNSFGVIFNFYDTPKKYTFWMNKQKNAREIRWKQYFLENKVAPSDKEKEIIIIHENLFPRFASRMKISNLKEVFSNNDIIAQSYYSENSEEIQECYDIIKQAYINLHDKELRASALAAIIKCRMKIEMLKIPIILDTIEEALDKNFSVVVFLNYRESLYTIAHYFDCGCLIHGGQTLEERTDSIENFQNNNEQLIICNILAGGVGLSLHDTHGDHPRMSIISPTWSGQDTQQALGRIHRANGKTPTIQKIIYVAETYEEHVCELMKEKLINITGINDLNLSGLEISLEKYQEEINSFEKKDLKEKIYTKVSLEKKKFIKIN